MAVFVMDEEGVYIDVEKAFDVRMRKMPQLVGTNPSFCIIVSFRLPSDLNTNNQKEYIIARFREEKEAKEVLHNFMAKVNSMSGGVVQVIKLVGG